MKKMGKFHYIIPVFVPDLGCPHQCVFCNQKRITGLDDVPDREKVAALVEDYLKTMPGGPGIKREVAYYGGSFTAIEPALQRASFTAIMGNFRIPAFSMALRRSTPVVVSSHPPIT